MNHFQKVQVDCNKEDFTSADGDRIGDGIRVGENLKWRSAICNGRNSTRVAVILYLT